MGRVMKSFKGSLNEIVEKDVRYKEEAYRFVMVVLDYTMGKLDKPRHVSGKELLEGIKEYAFEQFGPMTRTVLEHWGITSTEDFGHIVFNMVDQGILGKKESDSIDDFKNGYDFKEVFNHI